jgi:hypothetical protein
MHRTVIVANRTVGTHLLLGGDVGDQQHEHRRLFARPALNLLETS